MGIARNGRTKIPLKYAAKDPGFDRATGAEGFRNRGGKGSPHGLRLTISGKLGADAHRYQEKLVKNFVKKVNAK
jgi:hypothetical protein